MSHKTKAPSMRMRSHASIEHVPDWRLHCSYVAVTSTTPGTSHAFLCVADRDLECVGLRDGVRDFVGVCVAVFECEGVLGGVFDRDTRDALTELLRVRVGVLVFVGDREGVLVGEGVAVRDNDGEGVADEDSDSGGVADTEEEPLILDVIDADEVRVADADVVALDEGVSGPVVDAEAVAVGTGVEDRVDVSLDGAVPDALWLDAAVPDALPVNDGVCELVDEAVGVTDIVLEGVILPEPDAELDCVGSAVRDPVCVDETDVVAVSVCDCVGEDERLGGIE